MTNLRLNQLTFLYADSLDCKICLLIRNNEKEKVPFNKVLHGLFTQKAMSVCPKTNFNKEIAKQLTMRGFCEQYATGKYQILMFNHRKRSKLNCGKVPFFSTNRRQ